MAPAVVNTGKDYLVTLIKLASRPGTEPAAVAWGTGTTAEALTQTALVTESAEARTAGTSSQVTTSTTNDSYRVVGTITATAGRSITESGLFNSTTVAGSIMVTRATFTAIALSTSDSIQFTWTVRLADSALG